MVGTRAPSTNGDNGHGRDRRGRFVCGNPGGPGNPRIRSVSAWRAALAEVVRPGDIEAVTRTLVEHAKAGEPWAIRELLNRCLGRPGQGNEWAEPLNGQPPVEVDCRMDLDNPALVEASKEPLAPGLPSAADLLRGDP